MKNQHWRPFQAQQYWLIWIEGWRAEKYLMFLVYESEFPLQARNELLKKLSFPCFVFQFFMFPDLIHWI